MLGKCFAVICIISVIFAIITGNVGNLANAAVSGCADAVKLVFSMLGMMSFWSGILNVLKECGAIEKLSRILSPVLRFAFPKAWKTGVGKSEITAAISANVLGIGNAATPFAISAIEKMQAENPNKDTATSDMITLAVLGTASFNLFPSTILALLQNAGGTRYFGVIVPIWICSGVCSVLAILLSRFAGQKE